VPIIVKKKTFFWFINFFCFLERNESDIFQTSDSSPEAVEAAEAAEAAEAGSSLEPTPTPTTSFVNTEEFKRQFFIF
jgi:hypothetical protein